jgi:hypothetical protein
MESPNAQRARFISNEDDSLTYKVESSPRKRALSKDQKEETEYEKKI